MGTKICKEWYAIEGIDAVCPHCEGGNERQGPFEEGDTFACSHCSKKFKLGKETE